MRLANVESGHSPATRARLEQLAAETGEVPDVVKALTYRPELWGQPFSALLHQVMRGPSRWSAGERELFAAFVSAQNQCPF